MAWPDGPHACPLPSQLILAPMLSPAAFRLVPHTLAALLLLALAGCDPASTTDPVDEPGPAEPAFRIASGRTAYFRDGAWQDESQSSYTYDSRGLLTSILSESENGGTAYFLARVDYTYDAAGLRTEIRTTVTDGSQGVTLQRHDAAGRVSEARFGTAGGTWESFTSRTRSAYNAGGKEERLTFEFADSTGAWQPGYEYISSYNADGTLNEYLGTRWDGVVWAPATRNRHVYAAGVRTRYDGDEWRDGAWALSRRAVYAYDDDGNRSEIAYESDRRTPGTLAPDRRERFTWERAEGAGRPDALAGPRDHGFFPDAFAPGGLTGDRGLDSRPLVLSAP